MRQEELTSLLEGWGRFQKRLLALMCLPLMLKGFQTMMVIVILVVPQHRYDCRPRHHRHHHSRRHHHLHHHLHHHIHHSRYYHHLVIVVVVAVVSVAAVGVVIVLLVVG